MAEKAVPGPSDDAESDEKKEHSTLSEDRIPRASSLEFDWFPENLRHIVADYISDDRSDSMKLALLGKQYINLCLSPDANLELGSCWHFGCLSPTDRWESSMKVKVDKQYPIKDYRSCLDFLGRDNSSYYSIVVEVLVLQLDMSSRDLSSTLDDLQDTLVRLQDHLSSVQHVVLAIEKYAFCCFSFKDIIDNATGRRQTVNRPLALEQIVVNLRTCWKINQSLSVKLLLDYYIMSDAKPESDIYLSKFVVSISHCHNRDLFDAVDPTLKSSKLRWLYYLETPDEVNNVDQKIMRRCHAFQLDTLRIDGWNSSIHNFPPSYFFEDNPLIERIMIKTVSLGCPIQLPRPSAPLINTTPRSALIELTLKGKINAIHLTQLNNDYFPHLAHLAIAGGKATGHLDSHRVPCLRTLSIVLGSFWPRFNPLVAPLVREHTQSLINTGLPWQLVATKDRGGWSLASYEEPTTNPQDEEKENLFSSLPVIRELMLVMDTQRHANEFQSRLSRKAYLKANAGDRSGRRLVWAPQCVQKITAFCIAGQNVQLKFTENIPGQIRILASLKCRDMQVELDGAALPHLQSLEVNCGGVELSNMFPHLQTLFLKKTHLRSQWQIDAPLLQSFRCHTLSYGRMLFLRPALHPHLSFLQFKMSDDSLEHCPTILVDGDNMGLSRVNHVVFGKGMTESPSFYRWNVHHVLHLELEVDACKLPACWDSVEWHCETLKIIIHASNPKLLREQGITTIKLPPLLPRVKNLKVTSKRCHALLDSNMPSLTDLTMVSPRMLGPNLKCPALQRIRFTQFFTSLTKMEWLDPATYVAIGAQPRMVYFDFHGEVNKIS